MKLRFDYGAEGKIAVAKAKGTVGAQTMPDKWDQKCLDDAGNRYIQCMASAGSSESAKDQCQKTMSEEKKQCKKK